MAKHCLRGTAGGATPSFLAPTVRATELRICRSFSNLYPAERLQSELAEGIRPKHPEMPQVRFSPSDIASIYYYLHGKTPESEYRKSQ